MALVEMVAFLHGHVGRDILPAVPVDAIDRHRQDVGEALDLADLVVPPGGMAGLGDPEPDLRRMAGEDFAGAGDLPLPADPAARFAFPGSRKAVEADDVHDAEHAALTHEIQPLGVEGTRPAEHGAKAALAGPVSGGADHLAEGVPADIVAPVPVEQVVRLVPELDIGEMGAVAGQDHVDEVGIVAEPARRAGGGSCPRQGRGRVVDAGQKVDPGAERRDQPVIPFGAAGRVELGPGQVRAQVPRVRRAHAVEGLQDPGTFPGPEPFDEAEGASGVRH
ncbi:hypothetical protein A6302_04213 [Methylobrevis pamukkalensis]|uniref:Uncharacterized protein n=1 Tax=Methylobrevis pamukkalensis TaxID=1439726 RepID=A0A1E3GWU9_9HYPH|nr:hypothetical protein A6302_04213 [Methylobrevis pamukkalensis]